MHCPVIHFVWLFVQNTWPEKGSSLLGHNGDVVELRKVGPAAFLHIIQVQIKRQNSWAGLTFPVDGDVVVMNVVAGREIDDIGK
jgi:hypothetical protein